MTDDISYFRRRASEEAARARDAGDERVAFVHRALSDAYSRRVIEIIAPARTGQLVSSL